MALRRRPGATPEEIAVKLLLVEDDPDLLEVTAYALRREGFNVIMAEDGRQALRIWQANRPDVVILDLGLPEIDGLQVCRTIRQHDDTPVIMVTAQADEDQVVQGFRVGADDYVTKPFSPRQLAWRIRAVARRAASAAAAARPPALQFGDLTLESESHEVRSGDRVVRLTPTEFRLLYMLASNPTRVVSSDRLLTYAWGHNADDQSLLKTHFSHLRRKLDSLVADGVTIQSLPQVGYRLVWREPVGRSTPSAPWWRA
jgi:DNA-binding response OmpR family regulator